MRIQHLNCGTMHPVGSSEHLVAHVVVVEGEHGLTLIDSGFGSQDAENWRHRLGSSQHLLRPTYSPEETAHAQLRALGYDPGDVKHVVLTHFDADHVGGLVDFPHAQVHLLRAERDAVLAPRTLLEKSRYLPGTRAHAPHLVAHDIDRSNSWQGLSGAIRLHEVDERIVLLAMHGHTRGHAAVGLDLEGRALLHVGDTFYHRGQVGDADRAPFSLVAMGRFTNHAHAEVLRHRGELKELLERPDAELLVVSAHDPVLLERARLLNGQSAS